MLAFGIPRQLLGAPIGVGKCNREVYLSTLKRKHEYASRLDFCFGSERSAGFRTSEVWTCQQHERVAMHRPLPRNLSTSRQSNPADVLGAVQYLPYSYAGA